MEVEDQGTKSNLEESSSLQFVSQTFNIFVLCTENYIVEPLSLKFLIDHGFDFNRQYAQGLPYTRGNDQVVHSSACSFAHFLHICNLHLV